MDIAVSGNRKICGDFPYFGRQCRVFPYEPVGCVLRDRDSSPTDQARVRV
jgi:hypothetical protein